MLKKLSAISLLSALIISFSGVGAIADTVDMTTFFVSLSGNDNNEGTIEQPFATIEKARDEIRKFKRDSKLGKSGAKVYIRGGKYERKMSFVLEPQDSGTQEAPIVYSAYPGEEVSFSGAHQVDMSGAAVVTDESILAKLPEESRGKVIQINLKAQGISEIKKVMQTYYGVYKNPDPDLLWNGEFLTIARWPNYDYAKTGTILYTGMLRFENERHIQIDNDPGFIFRTDAPRMAMWKNAKDAWLMGYWRYNWAIDSVGIKDVIGNMVFTDSSTSFGVYKGAWYYIYNLLEEMDVPGEWYIDCDTGILYVYPPNPVDENTTVAIPLLNEEIIRFSNVSDVRIENLLLENGKMSAISINGGMRCEIAGCTIRNFAKQACTIINADHSGIRSCDIYNIGASPILIRSGDRSKLEAKGCYAVNNEISNFSRLEKVYTPAIRLSGVGNYMGYNKIHNSSHMAVGYDGNNHIIEFNEIYDVLKETSDAGAIYAGRDFVANGNIIRYNYLHDITGAGTSGRGVGIYFDDLLSGIVAYGNIINRVDLGFLVGGGRNIVIENNIIMNALEKSEDSMVLDARGMEKSWEATLKRVIGYAKNVPYQNDVWQQIYPEVYNVLVDDPGYPKNQTVRNNVIYRHGKLNINDYTKEHGKVENNLELDDSIGFTNEANEIYSLNKNSVVFEKIPMFKPIPFEKIGLYRDEFRTEIKKGEAK